MKKRLLCALTCVSMFLVACGGTKDSTGKIVTYKDNVKLGNYKGMELTQQDYEITDEDLQNKINSILEASSTTKHVKKGKVKSGDVVNINYEGKIDGKAFDGGTAKGYNLTIGSNSFIAGFEDGLIGVEVGKTVDLNLKFPDDYPGEEVKGKDCVFTVKVNYIEGEKVTPEWNDNFVQSTTEFDTVKEYEQSLKEELITQKEDSQKSELQYNAMEQLLAACTFNELPKDEVEKFSNSIRQYYTDYAKQYNMEYEDFVTQYFQTTVDEFEKQITSMAETSVKQKIACLSVAEKENLVPTDEEMDEKKLAIAKEIGFNNIEDFKKQYGDDMATDEVIRDVVLDWLIDNATIVKASDQPTTSAEVQPTEGQE